MQAARNHARQISNFHVILGMVDFSSTEFFASLGQPILAFIETDCPTSKLEICVVSINVSFSSIRSNFKEKESAFFILMFSD